MAVPYAEQRTGCSESFVVMIGVSVPAVSVALVLMKPRAVSVPEAKYRCSV